jgi:hypothetical protein
VAFGGGTPHLASCNRVYGSHERTMSEQRSINKPRGQRPSAPPPKRFACAINDAILPLPRFRAQRLWRFFLPTFQPKPAHPLVATFFVLVSTTLAMPLQTLVDRFIYCTNCHKGPILLIKSWFLHLARAAPRCAVLTWVLRPVLC